MMDSDGDGKTNGEELGDPRCVWTPQGGAPTNAASGHPGKTSTSWAGSKLTILKVEHGKTHLPPFFIGDLESR